MLTYPDREFVRRQYRDASRLNARIRLHERFSANPYGLQARVFDHFDLPEETGILDGLASHTATRESGEEYAQKVSDLTGRLEHELDLLGAIHITKDAGLFVACN